EPPQKGPQRLGREGRGRVVARPAQARDDAVADELVVPRTEDVRDVPQAIGSSRPRQRQGGERDERHRETENRKRPAGGRKHCEAQKGLTASRNLVSQPRST